MSLKVLLKCSDEEFERLISLMDVQVMTGRDVTSDNKNVFNKRTFNLIKHN